MLKKIFPKSNISIRDNLRWLFLLRNLMILAEAILILILVYGLKVTLPQEELWLALSSICVVNLYTLMRLETEEPVSELEIFSQISVDVLALGSLLYLTGGASNPIIWVFLLPIILTAIMLPQAYAWYMVILACCSYTVLIPYNIPLPVIEPHTTVPITIPDPVMSNSELKHYMHVMQDRHYFNLHMFGMWFGFVISAGLVAFFIIGLSKTVKEREKSLADAKENNLRDERVISLGTLAASAAHDMGTPLGTMAILLHEMKMDYPEQRFVDLHQKMDILNQQVSRCKQALSVLSASAGEMRAECGKAMSLIEYLDEIMNQWRTHNVTTKLNLLIPPSAIEFDTKIIADRTLTHSIINILNNAAEVSPANKGIDFSANWNDHSLFLKIRDFGPGFPEEVIKFIGKQPVKSSKKGLGVGLFLTYSTITRLGGKIELTNMYGEERGACIDITLPILLTKTENEHNENRQA